jgi:hypothetical protein
MKIHLIHAQELFSGEHALRCWNVVMSDGTRSKDIQSGVEERPHNITAFAADLGCNKMKEDRRKSSMQVWVLIPDPSRHQQFSFGHLCSNQALPNYWTLALRPFVLSTLNHDSSPTQNFEGSLSPSNRPWLLHKMQWQPDPIYLLPRHIVFFEVS